MGSKISILDDTSDTEAMAGIKRNNSRSCKTSMLLQCCKSPTISNNLDLTPEYEVHSKRTKKCLVLNEKEIKENIYPLKKSRISPRVLSSTNKNITNVTNKKLRVRKTADKGSYLAAFFKVFDDDVIQDFLWMDSCYRLSDKYLLAMVYTYFRRANLTRREYNRTNFFAALYLSHDMEEDNEDLKLEIFPWVLGDQWRIKHLHFINQRDSILQRMAYRAAVSKVTCDEVMGLSPSHPIWARERKAHHGGAERICEEDSDFTPRGPNASPLHCSLCEEADRQVYSPAFTSGYLSACSIEIASPLSDAEHNQGILTLVLMLTLPVVKNLLKICNYSLQEVKGLMVVDEDSDEILLCREE